MCSCFFWRSDILNASFLRPIYFVILYTLALTSLPLLIHHETSKVLVVEWSCLCSSNAGFCWSVESGISFLHVELFTLEITDSLYQYHNLWIVYCYSWVCQVFLYICLMLIRSQWPRGIRRRSAASRLLILWVRIPPGAWMFVVRIVLCQVEVSATGWSLVQRCPTDCDASLCVI